MTLFGNKVFTEVNQFKMKTLACPKPSMMALLMRRQETHRQAWHMMMETEIGVTCLQAKDGRPPREAGTGKEGSSL